jgi:hypothetical protein
MKLKKDVAEPTGETWGMWNDKTKSANALPNKCVAPRHIVLGYYLSGFAQIITATPMKKRDILTKQANAGIKGNG